MSVSATPCGFIPASRKSDQGIVRDQSCGQTWFLSRLDGSPHHHPQHEPCFSSPGMKPFSRPTVLMFVPASRSSCPFHHASFSAFNWPSLICFLSWLVHYCLRSALYNCSNADLKLVQIICAHIWVRVIAVKTIFFPARELNENMFGKMLNSNSKQHCNLLQLLIVSLVLHSKCFLYCLTHRDTRRNSCFRKSFLDIVSFLSFDTSGIKAFLEISSRFMCSITCAAIRDHEASRVVKPETCLSIRLLSHKRKTTFGWRWSVERLKAEQLFISMPLWPSTRNRKVKNRSVSCHCDYDGKITIWVACRQSYCNMLNSWKRSQFSFRGTRTTYF